MSDSSFHVRRLVTGLDSDGKSIIESDAPSPHVTKLNDTGSFVCADIWRTGASPSPARSPDALTTPTILAPTPGGTVVRVMRFPPEREMKGRGGENTFEEGDVSGLEAVAGQDTSIHPMMHKTRSVDYAIVLSGQIWAIMERGEALMQAGDVLVQRATSHSWANRSDEPCVIAFVLVDAEDK